MAKGGIEINLKVVYAVSAVIALMAVGTIAYTSIYLPACKDMTCFKESLWKCHRASFLSEGENSTWLYNINGLGGGNCNVYVKAVSIKTDVVTGTALQGQSMDCSIPKEISGAFMPEEKIEYCHGILKEEIQKQIIEKMHLYIVQNIAKINQTTLIV